MKEKVGMENCKKYSPGYFMPPEVCNDWAKKDRITEPPIWCSVDLRDGNQALIVPMSLEEKIEYFHFLVSVGFKEIEVGFPAASETEYKFLRALIERNMIPDDVTIQVLTQSRKHIIEKTFRSLKGVKNAIVHLYNSTSLAQREQVFKMSREEIIEIAKEGAQLVKGFAEAMPETNCRFQYSPESFTGTEIDFALEISNAVIDIWQPTPDKKAIINLPATVSMSMPHVYASQVEYMSKNLHSRDSVLISVHPHNDRGTAVADAELGVLAGADRIEGTLFGNGERTGNVDLITLGMNLFSHGVDPGLNFSDMPKLVEMYEKYTDLPVHPRHPYGGQLVFAAFSGSHQDAIAKGMKWHKKNKVDRWTVPYLLIDPEDVGRQYDADVIRINSQSGKGGIAYVLEQSFGYTIPRRMREELGYMVKDVSDITHKELSPKEILDIFHQEYVNVSSPVDIKGAVFSRVKSKTPGEDDGISVKLTTVIDNQEYVLTAEGNGRLDAVSNALRKGPYNFDFSFVTYSEHALESESNARAAAYVAITDSKGNTFWGVGIDSDIVFASIHALLSAINRQRMIQDENWIKAAGK